jgi:hypothetical protein
MRRLSCALTLVPLAALALALTGGQEPAGPQPAAAFHPVMSQHHLMEWQDRVFDALRKDIGGKKKDAADQAWLLAELSNVNTQNSVETDYQGWAGQVRDGALEIVKAVKAADFDRAKDLARTMDATCDACHDKYKK